MTHLHSQMVNPPQFAGGYHPPHGQIIRGKISKKAKATQSQQKKKKKKRYRFQVMSRQDLIVQSAGIEARSSLDTNVRFV